MQQSPTREFVRPQQMVVKHSVIDDVSVTMRDFGGCTIVTVPADVDAGRVGQILTSVAALSGHVVLDLGAARMLEPSSAAALAAAHRSANALGGSVRIVTKDQRVRSQLQAVQGVAPPVYDEIGDALEASMAARQAAAVRGAAMTAQGTSVTVPS